MRQEYYDLIDAREADAEHERLRTKKLWPDTIGGYQKVYQDPEDPNHTIYER